MPSLFVELERISALDAVLIDARQERQKSNLRCSMCVTRSGQRVCPASMSCRSRSIALKITGYMRLDAYQCRIGKFPEKSTLS